MTLSRVLSASIGCPPEFRLHPPGRLPPVGSREPPPSSDWTEFPPLSESPRHRPSLPTPLLTPPPSPPPEHVPSKPRAPGTPSATEEESTLTTSTSSLGHWQDDWADDSSGQHDLRIGADDGRMGLGSLDSLKDGCGRRQAPLNLKPLPASPPSFYPSFDSFLPHRRTDPSRLNSGTSSSSARHDGQESASDNDSSDPDPFVFDRNFTLFFQPPSPTSDDTAFTFFPELSNFSTDSEDGTSTASSSLRSGTHALPSTPPRSPPPSRGLPQSGLLYTNSQQSFRSEQPQNLHLHPPFAYQHPSSLSQSELDRIRELHDGRTPSQSQISPPSSNYSSIRNTGNSGPMLVQEGDWSCGSCGFVNWRRRIVCMRCFPFASADVGPSLSLSVQRASLLASPQASPFSPYPASTSSPDPQLYPAWSERQSLDSGPGSATVRQGASESDRRGVGGRKEETQVFIFPPIE